jgi:hypothetical protein
VDERFFYAPEMSGDAILADRMMGVTMGIGGPLLEQCEFVAKVIRSTGEDGVEIEGGAMGIAAAVFLAAKGLDARVTFPWERESW